MTSSKSLRTAHQPSPTQSPRRHLRRIATALALSLIILPATSPTSASQCRLPGLELYLPMNGDFNDASGNVRHGVATGNPAFIQGPFDGAALFDGVDDSVVFPSFPDDALADGDFSIGFWIELNESLDRISILSKRRTCLPGYFIDVRVDGFTFVDVELGFGAVPGTNGALQLGTGWTHVGIVREGATLRSYVNGQLVDEVTDADGSIWSSTDLAISDSPCIGVDGTQMLPAKLDELQIYSRALTADEMLGLTMSQPLFCDGFESGSTDAWSWTS